MFGYRLGFHLAKVFSFIVCQSCDYFAARKYINPCEQINLVFVERKSLYWWLTKI